MCLITDFVVDINYFCEKFNYISHTIYYNFCFPNKVVPEALKKYILDKEDKMLVHEWIAGILIKICELNDTVEKEIHKTIDSII